MDGDLFEEITGLSRKAYYRTMKIFVELLEDINYKCQVVKLKRVDQLNNLTSYFYKFIIVNDYDINVEQIMELSEDKRITYSLVIIYLLLKNKKRITLDVLSMIFPKISDETLANTKKLNDFFDIKLIKNEYASYIMIEED